MTILVTGGTGFIGKALAEELLLKGFTPQLVSRNTGRKASGNIIQVPNKGELFPSDLISTVAKVVNLAGESIAGRRWNRKVREQILNSRVEMTHCLVNSIRRNQQQGLPYPKVLVNASAIGYYGTHLSQIFTEKSENGGGFIISPHLML